MHMIVICLLFDTFHWCISTYCIAEYVEKLDRVEALMESRVAEVRASAKDDLEEENRNEIMAMRKQHIEEMGEMRKKDEEFFEVWFH